MDPADRLRDADAEAIPLDESEVVFILSLPRSGSTLLQRIIAAHTRVASATEPWLLLPLFYSLRSQGQYAEYGQGPAAKGLTHFVEELPGGRSAYLAEVSRFARGLYGRTRSDGETYFLDKTPRYGLIVDELREAFPGARFIFLWRQPLAIIASKCSRDTKL